MTCLGSASRVVDALSAEPPGDSSARQEPLDDSVPQVETVRGYMYAAYSPWYRYRRRDRATACRSPRLRGEELALVALPDDRLRLGEDERSTRADPLRPAVDGRAAAETAGWRYGRPSGSSGSRCAPRCARRARPRRARRLSGQGPCLRADGVAPGLLGVGVRNLRWSRICRAASASVASTASMIRRRRLVHGPGELAAERRAGEHWSARPRRSASGRSPAGVAARPRSRRSGTPSCRRLLRVPRRG